MEGSLDPNLATESLIGGKYLLKRVLGRGGMGAVYEAENTFLRAPVAIKVVRPEVARRDDVHRRFVQEAQAAAQVRHANIVSVLDFGYDEGRDVLYIVQELLEGTDLKRRLREGGPMAPREAIELLSPVMRALAFAHSKGVVHRDLKPDNIFLCDTPDGVVPKLIDFGIAKVMGDDGQSLQQTRTLMVMGTPLYMSPEQARGDRAVDHQTDIWQLGVVLYYALSGRHPYEAATHNLLTAAIITQAPTRIETYAPSLSPEVAALVHGAVAWRVEDRFPSMDAFWQAARACLSASPVARHAPVAPRLAEAPVSLPSPSIDVGTHAPHVVSVPSSTSRAGPLLWIAAALVLAALASVAFAIRVTRSNAPPPTAAATQPPRVEAVAPPPPAVSNTAASVDASAPIAQPLAPSNVAAPSVEAPRPRALRRERPAAREGAMTPRAARPSGASPSNADLIY